MQMRATLQDVLDADETTLQVLREPLGRLLKRPRICGFIAPDAV